MLLAEDDYLVRHGIERALDSQSDLDVVGSCGNLGEAVAAVETTLPDVVLTDIRMPPTHTDEGIRLAAHLADEHPGVGVVVLSQYDEPDYVLALLDRGTDGRAYLLKERVSDMTQLTGAIRSVAAGGSAVDPTVVARLVEARSRGGSPLDRLTARETEVLEQMATGKSNAGIGDELHIGIRSVEKHISSIFAKLGLAEEDSVNRRVQAVLIFLAAID